MSAERRQIEAAGGVVIRAGESGPEVAIVHRPRYDDWSLPKGKLDPGESFEGAALREVEEETGLRCELGRELTPVRYMDRKGRPKLVRYWLMDVVGGDFAPNDEVDEMLWLSPREAMTRLDHDNDADLVREALS